MTPSVYKSVASTLKLSWCINFILVLSIRFYFGSLDVSLTVMVQSEITIKENWTTKKKPENKPNMQENSTEQKRAEKNRTEQQRVRERIRKKWRTKCIYQPWLLLLLAYIIVYIFIYFSFFSESRLICYLLKRFVFDFS